MFYFWANNLLNNKLTLNDNDFFHLTKVARIKSNETFLVKYDKKIYYCQLSNLSKNECSILNVKVVENKIDTIGIIMGLPKRKTFFKLLPFLCELGIDNIYITNSSSTQFTINDVNETKKFLERSRAIIKESCCQSKNFNEPKIVFFLDLKTFFKFDLNFYKLRLSCDELVDFKHQNIFTLLKENKIKLNKILYAIGPEGGFTEQEKQLFKENSFKSVSLNNNILKVETAAITTLNIIKTVKKYEA